MFIRRDPLTSITRAPLKFTTRAHYIYDTFSKLSLFQSNIPFHSPVSFHLQIQPVSQHFYLSLPPPPPPLPSLISSTHLPSPETSRTIRLFYFSSTRSRLTQDRNQLITTQCFAAYVLPNWTVEFNRIRQLPAQLRIVMQNAIMLAMAYLFIKLSIQKILITL